MIWLLSSVCHFPSNPRICRLATNTPPVIAPSNVNFIFWWLLWPKYIDCNSTTDTRSNERWDVAGFTMVGIQSQHCLKIWVLSSSILKELCIQNFCRCGFVSIVAPRWDLRKIPQSKNPVQLLANWIEPTSLKSGGAMARNAEDTDCSVIFFT